MLKRIDVAHLRTGMFIHEFCGSWMEHPFWRTSFLLDDPADLKRITESSIRELWIDTSRGLGAEAGQTREESEEQVDRALIRAAEAPRIETPVPIAAEMARAAKVVAKSKQAVAAMFQEARMGKAIDAEHVAPLVDEISRSVMRNPGALISVARLKTVDDYTYMHSVAVCALMMSLANQLGVDETSRWQIGMAGLVHDLGKALTPAIVLNKPGKLTEAEFSIMKQHPEDGHRLLQEGMGVGPIPLDVCLHHHEKMDGSGYPHGLDSERISLHARMGAVCDVYDAITSNRPYKAGWDPAESVRRMAEWCTGHFDERVFQAFVKSVGIYPVGALVRLESDRLAVVIDQHSANLLTPTVKVFFSVRSNNMVRPEVVDLSRANCQDRITSREDPAKWNLPSLPELWLPA